MRADSLELLLVGSAASLLEGDDLTIDIEVSGSVPVVVRSVAAQVAHPCPNGGSTRQAIQLRIADRARVYWAVEPLIIAAGAEHSNEFSVDIDSQSACVLHDTMLLGRSGEDPKTAVVCAQMFIKQACAPVLEDGLVTTLPGAHGPAGLHGMRFASTVIAAGWRPASAILGVMALAGPGALRRSISPDATSGGSGLAETAASWWAELLQTPYLAQKVDATVGQ
jgi:urease accessory protein